MTKTTYAQFVTEDRRLSILLILLESSAYTANHHLLKMALDRLGFWPSTDQVKTDLAWLQEQGLLHVELLADIQIAKLTARGQDAAEARITVPGVKRPSAGA